MELSGIKVREVKKNKTISEDEEITTKPEEIKTPEKTINKENLNELKMKIHLQIRKIMIVIVVI